ncbi:MAG: hypothetical protein HY508_12540 [Acidobacteria bacterium]|nr:hypothetical protein [Acidobacteriota bacterium]
MTMRVRWVCALLLAGILGLAWGLVFSAPRNDSEADLTARIARESDLVKKAKYEVRLARVKLIQALDARENGELETSLKLLGAYLETVKSAWDHLRQSGRVAHKKSQGFKELDIELREDGRYLEDLKRSVSFMDRGPVEKVIQEVESLRAEVLKVLFPTMAPPSR